MSEPAPYLDVARRLKWLRKSQGMTQVEFADSLKCKRAQIGNWELGLQRPALDFGLRIVARYPVNMDWIYRGVDDALPGATLDAWRQHLAEEADRE